MSTALSDSGTGREPSAPHRSPAAGTTDPTRGARATVLEDGHLDIESEDAELIGDTALAAGQPIYGMSTTRSDLEEMFVRLTEQHGNRNEEA